MAKYNKAYKFRLYPTEEQAHLMRKTFGCVRFSEDVATGIFFTIWQAHY
ncbi:IS605 transposase OrfB [Paenibacillus terrae HPL-003]|uniref:IS605 transposase OrfB n=1 Tax=Paenibacillus terrae (strain HPL-003) TaxID=985665 RepID=G7VRT3_PAETH|nr:IS605 transposase OrfB [Paenibacillus terrae HPL-003]